MSSGTRSESSPAPSPEPKRPTSYASRMLTPSEIEALRRNQREVDETFDRLYREEKAREGK